MSDTPDGFAIEFRDWGERTEYVVFQGCGCGHAIAGCATRDDALRVARMAAALQFYADPATYNEQMPPVNAWGDGTIPIREDQGARARDALEHEPQTASR